MHRAFKHGSCAIIVGCRVNFCPVITLLAHGDILLVLLIKDYLHPEFLERYMFCKLRYVKTGSTEHELGEVVSGLPAFQRR